MTPKTILRALFCCAALSTCAAAFGAQNTFPDRGTCGFAGTWSYPFTYLYGHNPGPGWGVTTLGTFDFGAKTFAANIVLLNPAGSASTEAQLQAIGTFSVSPGPIPGSALLTAKVTLDGSQTTMTFNALPVGRGDSVLNSVLIQTGPGPIGSADGGFVADCKF
jgi:hypothetical protein